MVPILIKKKCLINKINNKSSAINKGKKWKINYKNIKSKKKRTKKNKNTPTIYSVLRGYCDEDDYDDVNDRA